MGDVAATLRSILPPSQGVPDEDWARSLLLACPQSPPPLVFPQTSAELAAVVTAGYERGWKLLPCGGGSKLGWGCPMPKADVAVSTARLSRVIDHWVEDFTVRVEAGVRLADLQRQLQAHGQFLPVDPLFPERATLGGIVATADTGSLRQRYGGLRDLLIGVQFVRNDGAEAKAGGRVVKNVAGYDLMKLMTGSFGTLAVLSELTLKLYPLPERSQSVQVNGSPEAIAATALQIRRSGLTPAAMDWASSGELSLLGRFEGLSEAVDEQINRLKALAEGETATVTLVPNSVWQQQRQELEQQEILCKVGLRATAAADFFAALQSLPPGWRSRLHNASGLGLVAFAATDRSAEVIATVRSRCAAAGGFLTVLTAPPAVKASVDVWGYQGSALATMKQLKANFDPTGLFSAGRFVDGP